MKYIGIDYGTKKVGIAVSDALGTLAFPREVMLNNGVLVNRIAALIVGEGINGVVIGESRDLSGGLNPVAADAKRFADALNAATVSSIDVYYEDERFTTKQARSLPSEGAARGDVANKRKSSSKSNGLADAQAAAIILQSFLDKAQNVS